MMITSQEVIPVNPNLKGTGKDKGRDLVHLNARSLVRFLCNRRIDWSRSVDEGKRNITTSKIRRCRFPRPKRKLYFPCSTHGEALDQGVLSWVFFVHTVVYFVAEYPGSSNPMLISTRHFRYNLWDTMTLQLHLIR